MDKILEKRLDLKPASSGKTTHRFTPDPEKTFQRGSTDYFAHGRREENIAAFDSPKFLGTPIGEIIQVNNDQLAVRLYSDNHVRNGDGISFLYRRESKGFTINAIWEEARQKAIYNGLLQMIKAYSRG